MGPRNIFFLGWGGKTDNMGLKAKYKFVVEQEGCPNFDFLKLSGVEFLDKNRGNLHLILQDKWSISRI